MINCPTIMEYDTTGKTQTQEKDDTLSCFLEADLEHWLEEENGLMGG